MAAGREDIDVRMLGTGRPFIVEISDAKLVLSEEELADLQSRINAATDLVQVRDLQNVDKCGVAFFTLFVTYWFY